MAQVRTALAGEPIDLLAVASSVVAALERRGHPIEQSEPSGPTLTELVGTFIEVDRRETSALLAALSVLTPDQLLATRMQRALAERTHPLPDWLTGLSGATVDRAVEFSHVLGDGDNIVLGVRLPGGEELTVIVYIDHNLGTVVKDAFVVPAPVEAVVEMYSQHAEDPDLTFADLDLAAARAKVRQAVELGAMTWPPYETETWPACKPLTEWVLRLLPDGGTGYEPHEWDEAALEALTARFLAGEHGRALTDPDHASLLESLLWYGSGYSGGDPLRWSVVRVEMVLLDWIPRKILADAEYLAKAPTVLRALIRFSHAERGIGKDLTEETLEAVDDFEPAYLQTIRSPRLQGPEALLAAAGWLDDPHASDDDIDVAAGRHDVAVTLLEGLARAVGGPAALAELDTAPLPDEPFDWTGIPDDIHERVAAVLATVDRVCDAELDDVELRTASRRLLATVAAGDPRVFRRAGSTDISAAAICWMVGRASRLFSPYGLTVKDFLASFGLKSGSVSQRAATYLKAGGFSTEQYGGMDLGSPRYLTSAGRLQIVEARDLYLGWNS
jgi:hypothetical protein